MLANAEQIKALKEKQNVSAPVEEYPKEEASLL